MDNRSLRDLDEDTSNHEVRGWVNKALAALCIFVFGYVGTEIGEFRRTISHTDTIMQKLSDHADRVDQRISERSQYVDKVLGDHETRIREMEFRRRKGN
jgi:glutaredoxin 2